MFGGKHKKEKCNCIYEKKEVQHSSLKSEENTKKEIDSAIDEIKNILFKLREMSAEYMEIIHGKKKSNYRYVRWS